MNEQELSALIRRIVTERVSQRERGDSVGGTSPTSTVERADASYGSHFSHSIHIALVNAGDACLIEPDVACTHCNYCKSHGH